MLPCSINTPKTCFESYRSSWSYSLSKLRGNENWFLHTKQKHSHHELHNLKLSSSRPLEKEQALCCECKAQGVTNYITEGLQGEFPHQSREIFGKRYLGSTLLKKGCAVQCFSSHILVGKIFFWPHKKLQHNIQQLFTPYVVNLICKS